MALPLGTLVDLLNSTRMKIFCQHNHAGVQLVVNRHFDEIANVDADRLAAINVRPVSETGADSFPIAPPVVRALRGTDFGAAGRSSPTEFAIACAILTQAVAARAVIWAYTSFTTLPREVLVAIANMFDAIAAARAAVLAHEQGASYAVVSGLAFAFATRDVAYAMAATLVRACLVVAEFARGTEEPRLAFALAFVAHASFVALQRAGFHCAADAMVS